MEPNGIRGEPQMILRTAINSLVASTPINSSGTRYIDRSLTGYLNFVCGCGNGFSLRETNGFKDFDSVICVTCSRQARLSPNIGERYVYKRVKSDAVRYEREFNIEFDDFVKLISSPCHYCGYVGGNSISVPSKVSGEWLVENFRYNGIDRVNNDLGYINGNCVPSCFICNRAKGSLSIEEFKEWIGRVANNDN